ncbi:hypothetical protein BGZ65_012458 [Modicella reniformis]|uniref:Uncharacterized protein n=1 Tax=Modicella reniformis TaxID=1440133 RepID=A0A9P6JFE2_9FUNG|nr:hypothetical protein BGZ65_012458 [Modicella reniformis]
MLVSCCRVPPQKKYHNEDMLTWAPQVRAIATTMTATTTTSNGRTGDNHNRNRDYIASEALLKRLNRAPRSNLLYTP